MTSPSDLVRNGRSSVRGLLGVNADFKHQPLGEHIDPGGLEGYWCDLRHKSVVTDGTTDLLPRDGGGRAHDWVIPVAQAALGAWERRYYGEDTDERFLALADLLRRTAVEEDSGSLRWYIGIRMPKYALEPGWSSAMGQAQTMSVFLRAYRLTADEAWADAARRALGPLLVPVADGGLQRDVDGSLVLEEYPTPTPCAVLNGWIFTLLGVFELATATGDDRARDLFARSRAGLLALLPRYDVGWWSLYSLFQHGRSDLAKPFYQRLHPVMLHALHLAAPDSRLPAMADRWCAQLTPASIARTGANKVAFRLYRGVTPVAA